MSTLDIVMLHFVMQIATNTVESMFAIYVDNYNFSISYYEVIWNENFGKYLYMDGCNVHKLGLLSMTHSVHYMKHTHEVIKCAICAPVYSSIYLDRQTNECIATNVRFYFIE